MPGRSCQRTCPLWWTPLVLDRGRTGAGWPSRGAREWLAGGRGTRWALWETSRIRQRTAGWLGAVVHWVGRVGAGGRLARAFHEYRDFAHF